jgi:hypothetical protein
MMKYGGVNVQSHIFLTSALAGGEWSSSRSGRFTPGGKAQDTHWIGDWVYSEPVWTWRSENSCPHRDTYSDPLVVIISQGKFRNGASNYATTVFFLI